MARPSCLSSSIGRLGGKWAAKNISRTLRSLAGSAVGSSVLGGDGDLRLPPPLVDRSVEAEGDAESDIESRIESIDIRGAWPMINELSLSNADDGELLRPDPERGGTCGHMASRSGEKGIENRTLMV